MLCPKCGNRKDNNEVCESCGIYFEKYRKAQERIYEEPGYDDNESTLGKKVLIAVIALSVIGVGYAMFRSSSKANANNTIATAPTATDPSQDADSDGVESLAAQLDDWSVGGCTWILRGLRGIHGSGQEYTGYEPAATNR